jgi:hypothetical protein
LDCDINKQTIFDFKHLEGKNVYAETCEQLEIRLAEIIVEKAEIAEEKAKLKEGAD